MLNFWRILVAILKMATGRNFSMSGINSGHLYLPTYQILMISKNVEFLPPIYYTVFWQTSWKVWKRRIAPLMVTYRYFKFYVSIIIHLEVISQCWIFAVLWWPFWKWRPVEIFQCRDIIIYPHIKFRWYRTMLNLYRSFLCRVLAAILKILTTQNCPSNGELSLC